jgi:patatin-like phospholipase/acyl hydrolase
MPASSENPLPMRILSLDGGGVRGISSLYILKELMVQASLQLAADKPNEPRSIPRPCQVFDIICGTSTGGLIALMLGRLEMVNPLLFFLFELDRLCWVDC